MVAEPHAIYDDINREIARLFKGATVLTFVDARSSPFNLQFRDHDRRFLAPPEPTDTLAQCFSDFREALQEPNDAPLWVCALHVRHGTKTGMMAFYESDYDFELGCEELMLVVLKDQAEHLQSLML